MTDTLVVLPTLDLDAAQRAYHAAGRVTAGHWFLAIDSADGDDLNAHKWLDPWFDAKSISLSDARRGLVGAYNAGFAHFLKGDWQYLHLLEDGILPPPGYLLTMRTVLEAHPDFGWVGVRQWENPLANFTSLCSLMTRECAEKVQGLSEEFAPCQFDDGDLYMRVKQAGYEPHGLPVKVSHPVSRTSRVGTIEEDRALMLRHQAKFAAKWNLPDMDWLAVPLHHGCERCGLEAPPRRCAFCLRVVLGGVVVDNYAKDVSACGECVLRMAESVKEVAGG